MIKKIVFALMLCLPVNSSFTNNELNDGFLYCMSSEGLEECDGLQSVDVNL